MSTVLIVDDIAMDRRLAGRLLEKHADAQVAYASNGKEALAAIQAEPPDVVVTDLQMPEMNGLELVEAVRSDYPEVPVILMTAHGSEEIAAEALRRGAAFYVPKKNLTEDLVASVLRVLAAVEASRRRDELFNSLMEMTSYFQLDNDRAKIPPLVAYMQECLASLKLCEESDRVRVGIALEEALLNALFHGNLELSSDLRQEDENAYYEAAEERRRRPPYKDRRIHFKATLGPEEAVFVVRDEGPGFDVGLLPDPTDPSNMERVGGRGILLIRTFMDEARHNEAGNELVMVKRRPEVEDVRF